MKTLIKKLSFALVILLIGNYSYAQETTNKKAETILLTQIDGDFEGKKELTLKAGQPYIFEVSNNGVDHEVGFVIAPKGKTDQEHHIKNAYVKEMIANGKSSTSQEVIFEAGEYEYFCPLNPTPHYSIIVK